MNKLTQKQRSALQAERLKRGRALRAWRRVYKLDGLTQVMAGAYFNVSVHTYAKWERGDTKAPDAVMAKI